MLCRKTVEMACREQGAKGRDLKDRIDQLRKMGVIDDRLYQWADALRDEGNSAAHAPVQHKPEDVADAIAFTRALLDNIYVLSERFRRYKTRTKTQQVGSDSEPTGGG